MQDSWENLVGHARTTVGRRLVRDGTGGWHGRRRCQSSVINSSGFSASWSIESRNQVTPGGCIGVANRANSARLQITSRIMRSQVTGGLEISEPCEKRSQTMSNPSNRRIPADS